MEEEAENIRWRIGNYLDELKIQKRKQKVHDGELKIIIRIWDEYSFVIPLKMSGGMIRSKPNTKDFDTLNMWKFWIITIFLFGVKFQYQVGLVWQIYKNQKSNYQNIPVKCLE